MAPDRSTQAVKRKIQLRNGLFRVKILFIGFPGEPDKDPALLFLYGYLPVKYISGIQPLLNNISGRFQFFGSRLFGDSHRLEHSLHTAFDINAEPHMPNSLNITSTAKKGNEKKDSNGSQCYPNMCFFIFHDFPAFCFMFYRIR